MYGGVRGGRPDGRVRLAPGTHTTERVERRAIRWMAYSSRTGEPLERGRRSRHPPARLLEDERQDRRRDADPADRRHAPRLAQLIARTLRRCSTTTRSSGSTGRGRHGRRRTQQSCSRATTGRGGSPVAGRSRRSPGSRGTTVTSTRASRARTSVALRRHLAGRLDVWEADSGTLRPLLDGDDEVTDECENLWLRPSGAEPWEYDVILMHTTPTTWTFKRDARISRPLAEILWERDGIRYLAPEVQLLHKARAAAAPGPGRLRRVRPAARRTRAGVAPRRAGAGAPRPPVAPGTHDVRRSWKV